MEMVSSKITKRPNTTYELAAEQGDADAQFNLGDFYEKGHGIEKDYEKAKEYYQLASDQGHAKARAKLFEIDPSS